MIPIGFDVAMVLRFIAGLGIAAAVWWVADAIGDAREAKIYARIDRAIESTNAEIDKRLTLDERVAAVAEAARAKALSDALRLPSVAVACPANKAQAEALSAIK